MNQIATIVLCRIFLNGLKICQRTYVCVHYGCFVFIIVLTECLNYIFNFNINTPVQIELLSYVKKFVSYLMPLHNVCDGEFTENVLPARFTWYQRTLIIILIVLFAVYAADTTQVKIIICHTSWVAEYSSMCHSNLRR